METAIPVGADAPTPFALEMTAPAETPAHLSTHDAAAVLRKLRQPKNDQTTERASDAASADTTESTAEKAGESAAETPPAQTTDTDRQEEPAPIEPPRESDFLRRQNEAAEKLKGLTAKEQAVEQARQTYEAALPQLLQTLQQQQAGEFADIKSMADVERLAREDWPRYLLWDLQQKKIADVTQQLLAN